MKPTKLSPTTPIVLDQSCIGKFAIWSYDIFPYLKGGKIAAVVGYSGCNKTLVECENYGKGYWFTPTRIVELNVGEQMMRELNRLEHEYQEKKNELYRGYMDKVNEVMSIDDPAILVGTRYTRTYSLNAHNPKCPNPKCNGYLGVANTNFRAFHFVECIGAIPTGKESSDSCGTCGKRYRATPSRDKEFITFELI